VSAYYRAVTKSRTGTWDLGTQGHGTQGRGDARLETRGRGTPGCWNLETRLDAWGLEDVINKQHLTFALNLRRNSIFGG